ncbi:hypothetical protein PRIC2_009521 [Phytophthora ramorum]
MLPQLTKYLLERVVQVSIVFVALYCITTIIIWVRWAEMEDLPGLPLDADEELDISSEGLGSSEYPSHAWQKHEFQCLGWVETDDDGDELGTRRECWQRIRAGDAGYCEVTNSTSGEVFHVMHTTSLSLKDDARFTCELAKAFSSFRFHAATYRHDPPMALSTTDTEGIAMAVYDSVLPNLR